MVALAAEPSQTTGVVVVGWSWGTGWVGLGHLFWFTHKGEEDGNLGGLEED